MKIEIPSGLSGLAPVVSVSGGKDSTATVLALREAGVEARYVFADTGWEAQETYGHVADLERRLGISVVRVGVEGGMVGKILRRAGFPTRLQRWCTGELKVEPIRAYHERLAEESDSETVSVIGIRNEESPSRARIEKEFEFDHSWKGYVWRPILRWTVADVIAIHHRHGIPVNPLYKKGFGRVGCNPCIYATKEEIELTAVHFPERIDQIRDMERECTALRAERNAVSPGRYAHPVATFFQSKQADKIDGKLVYRTMDIDDMVAWSRTSRGGVQLKIIREEPTGGCYRWGMCEPPARDGGDE